MNAQDKILEYFRNREKEKEEAKLKADAAKEWVLVEPVRFAVGWIAYQSKTAEERKKTELRTYDQIYQSYKLLDVKNLFAQRSNEVVEELKTVEPYRLIHETAAKNYEKLQKESVKLAEALRMLEEFQHPNTVTTFAEGLAASMQEYEADMAKLEADKLEINAAEFDQTEKKKTVGSNHAGHSLWIQ